MKENQDFRQSLRRIRMLQILVFFMILICGPLVVAILLITNSSTAPMYFAFTWMGLTVIIGIIQGTRKCPRCHSEFFIGKHWNNAFAQRCMNCKLPLNANDDDL